MDDLLKLNRIIAAHWLGSLDNSQEEYLRYTSVCVGILIATHVDLAEVLGRSKHTRPNSLSVARLNREYLRFARLATKDVAAGKIEMLIRLDITLDQAQVLRNLTDEGIDRLAFGWDGPIVSFASEAFIRGLALHHRAAKYHAAAFVAIRLQQGTVHDVHAHTSERKG